MKNYRGFNAETKSILNKVMNKLTLTLKAEEVPPVNAPVVTKPVEGTEPPKPTVNYEDLIAKARKEEKEKLYKQMQTKDSKVNELTEKNNNLMLKVGQQEEEIASLKKDLASAKEGGAKIESEEVARLTKEKDDLAQQIENLKKSQTDVQSLEEGIRAEYEVKMYRLEKLQEVGNSIIPELVSGTTKEDIDASIEISKQRYLDIVGSVAPTQPKVNPVPTGNPTGQDFNISNLNSDDIAQMSPKDWMEYRRKLGLK